MFIVNIGGAETMSHDGQQTAAVQGSTFDLPRELAEHLLRFPHWRLPDEHELPDGKPAEKRGPGRPRRTPL